MLFRMEADRGLINALLFNKGGKGGGNPIKRAAEVVANRTPRISRGRNGGAILVNKGLSATCELFIQMLYGLKSACGVSRMGHFTLRLENLFQFGTLIACTIVHDLIVDAP